jgi:endonuclease III
MVTARELVERLGGHPAAELGIDPAEDTDAGRWLVAACLLAGRVKPELALAAYRSLAAEGLPSPAELAGADPIRIAWRLADVAYPKPEVAAGRLRRASAALIERWEGSPAALARDAADLEDLGARVTGLAPGLGRATALHFLRPLRDVWTAAREIPLSPAALAAAVHLGWLRPGEDADGEPGALRAVLAEQSGAPTLTDAEAALDRLGRRACLRERPDRCPLADSCPLR